MASEAFTSYRIEAFSDSPGDGEGETLLGAGETTTDGTGASTFLLDLAGSPTPGEEITLTATKLSGPGGAPIQTSEFSSPGPSPRRATSKGRPAMMS